MLRIVIAALIWTMPAFGAYAHNHSATANPAAILSTQTNFSFLIKETRNEFKTVANGGHIVNTVSFNGQTCPADMKITSDVGGTTPLQWDCAEYSATTGYLEIYVKIPSLTTSTVVYMFYGDAAVTTYQGGSIGAAYDSNHVGRFHFAGPTLNIADSSASLNTGANHGATSGTGQLGGGAACNGTSQWVQIGSVGNLGLINMGTVGTAIFWVNYQSAADSVVLGGYAAAGAQIDYAPYIDGASAGNSIYYRAAFAAANGPVSVVHGGLSGLTQIAIVRNGTSVSFFKNGAQLGTTQTMSNNNVLGYSNLCSDNNSTTSTPENFFQGVIDELSLATTNRSSNWIAMEYANQSSPSTFYTMNAEDGGSSSPANRAGAHISGGNFAY